jgi:ribosomal protein S18 acetylase RimI-like enzyme
MLRLPAYMAHLNSGLTIEDQDPSGDHARYCLKAYFAELQTRFPGGFDPEAGGASAVGDFSQPTGCLKIAMLDGRPVGCGALRTLEAGVGEIKRMWVSPQVRGLGVGRSLLRALEFHARERGMRTVRLDTNASLKEAQRLYRSEGYREIARFNDNPYAQHWFEKTLEPARQENL